jgi:serine/threonine-protein kinase
MISAPSPTSPSKAQPSRLVGRYVMYDEIASGGMASVHFGRMRGAVGFSRTVAIKSLHPHFARDAEFISMFLDEVRLVSRIKQVHSQVQRRKRCPPALCTVLIPM